MKTPIRPSARLILVIALLAIPAAAQVPSSSSVSPPSANVLISAPSSIDTGLSIRWRMDPPAGPNQDTDAGARFTVPASGAGAALQSITVRIASAGSGVFNSNAPNLPLVFDFFTISGATYTNVFRETSTIPGNAAAGSYVTFDLSSKGVTLAPGEYAFLIGSNVADSDLTNEPNRFRLAVDANVDTLAGANEIRREGFFGVDADLGPADPRPGPNVPPNQNNPGRDPVFYLQATIPTPPVITDVAFSAGTFRIDYLSETGVSFQVRRSPDLTGDPLTTWTVLPDTVAGDGTPKTYLDATAAGPRNFYVLIRP